MEYKRAYKRSESEEPYIKKKEKNNNKKKK